METDEIKATSVEKATKEIYKHINRENPKPLYTVGLSYKILGLLMKILPSGMVNKVLYKMYAK